MNYPVQIIFIEKTKFTKSTSENKQFKNITQKKTKIYNKLLLELNYNLVNKYTN